MKRAATALAPVFAAACVLVAGSDATGTGQVRVGYVALTGTIAGKRTLLGEPLLGFRRAITKPGVQGKVLYVPPNQDATAALASFARQRYDLVINGVPDPNPVDPVARRFPRVKFFLPDFPIQALEHRRKNVLGSRYIAEEAGYLAGYLAALMEDRRRGEHVISAVGGVPFPGVARWIVGYRAGARKADPSITIEVDYTGDFSNPAKCRTVALKQIADGSGVVFNVAGACGLGALQAAKAKGVWGIGVDVDQSYLGRHILTSAVIRLDRGVFATIGRLVRGNLTTGKNIEFDLRNGNVGLGKISPKVPHLFLRRLANVRRAIIAGRIRVPRVT